jgi:peptide/nickel transport system permease protein
VVAYIAKRLGGVALTMFVVAGISFLLMSVIPGDAAFYVLGTEATGAEVEQFREQLGLNKPLHTRMLDWYSGILRGDLGESVTNIGKPVLSLILERLEPTLLLTALATLIGVVLGLGLGIGAAVNKGGIGDFFCMILAMLGISVPSFWLGLGLILVFALNLKVLPTAGFAALRDGSMANTLRYLILPATALGVSQAGVIARMARANLLQVLSDDYMVTARAKGLSERRVILVHGLRNAMIPTLGVIGISIALMLGGAIILESVFVLPGIGSLVISSILHRDYPVIQGVLMFTAMVTALVNLLVDLLYGAMDPRVRERRRRG